MTSGTRLAVMQQSRLGIGQSLQAGRTLSPDLSRGEAQHHFAPVAKSRGLIEQSGIDGMGKPKYRATVPASTHAAPVTVN